MNITAQSFHNCILHPESRNTSSHNTGQKYHIWGQEELCGLFHIVSAPVSQFGPFSLVIPANVRGVIPWLRYLVTGLLTHKSRLNLRPLEVVDKLAMAQVLRFVQALLY
jgi:hypothetical protein